MEALLARLVSLERQPDTPLGDIGWLRLRCEDTLGTHGGDDYWCRLSLRQLKKDAATFNDRFPALLDPDLLMALENLPVRV